MSGVTQFKLDFSEWEWRMIRLEDCPQSEVEELRQAIRDDWTNLEKREYWMWRAADEAKFSRELKAMANDATARIKAAAKMEKAA